MIAVVDFREIPQLRRSQAPAWVQEAAIDGVVAALLDRTASAALSLGLIGLISSCWLGVLMSAVPLIVAAPVLGHSRSVRVSDVLGAGLQREGDKTLGQ